MKNNVFKLMTLMVGMLLFIVSCDELTLDQPEVDTNAAADNAITTRAVGDVFSAIDNSLSTSKAAVACPTITLESSLLTINYGSGCPGADGVYRTGIITASLTGMGVGGWANDASAVVSFNNYTIDGKELTGVITITCKIVNQVKSFNIEGLDLSLSFSDQTSITWNPNNTMTFIKSDQNGSYWSITGTSNGISRKGVNFSNSSNNLLTDPTCKWFVGGKLTITQGDIVDVLTFGTCGNVSIKHNNLPAIEVNLNTL